MASTKTKKYIVIKRGVCLKGTTETEIDTKVDLTDEKAAGMVGKVRLLKDYEAESKGTADLKKEVASLTKANAALTKQVEEMTAALATPAAPVKTAKK